MKKTICSVVKDLLLTGAGIAVGIGSALAYDLPERFKNYKDNAVMNTQPLATPNGFFCAHKYDLDRDKLADVIELYPAFPYPNGTMEHISEFPASYWFDLNSDKKITDNEILVDEMVDGINGNEYWVDQPKKQPKELHKNQKGVNYKERWNLERDEDLYNVYQTGRLSFRRTPKTVYEKIKLPQESDSLILRP